MEIPWKNLAPHRPLTGGSVNYVERSDLGGGERLARRIAASSQPQIITGPVGVGKSTELGHVTDFLTRQLRRPCALVQLDRSYDMLKVTVDNVLNAIVNQSGFPQPQSGIPTLDRLRKLLQSQSEAKILIDGLEKSSEQIARQVVQTLVSIDQDGQCVIVVPYSLIKGKSTRDRQSGAAGPPLILQAIYLGEDLPNQESEKVPAYRFFIEIFERRLGSIDNFPLEFRDSLLRAAYYSGGIPRVFLQQLLDAATNASLAGRNIPNDVDFADAARAQQLSLRNILRKGDREALRKTLEGDDDLEMPFDRRLRLIEEGALLEYSTWEPNTRSIARPAPLLRSILTEN